MTKAIVHYAMTTSPSDPQNLEPRIARNEVDIREIKLAISELRSTVATLADVVAIQQEEAQADREQAQADREQARADRALMLQLIQAIAQGRNGG